MKGSQAAIAAIVIVVVAAAVVALYRGGYGPGQPTQQPGENQVNIQGFAFIPSSITVSAGTTITWKNLDSAVHDVTSTGGPASFYSGNLSQGQTWQFTFENAGTYTYKCSIHPYMTGTVTVQ
jgi:plastocyanin